MKKMTKNVKNVENL